MRPDFLLSSTNLAREFLLRLEREPSPWTGVPPETLQRVAARWSSVRRMKAWLDDAVKERGSQVPHSTLTRWLFTAKLSEDATDVRDALIPCIDHADPGLMNALVDAGLDDEASQSIALGLAQHARGAAADLDRLEAARVGAAQDEGTEPHRCMATPLVRTKGQVVQLRLGEVRMKLTLRSYDRLAYKFQGTEAEFHEALFCMLCVYETLNYRDLLPPVAPVSAKAKTRAGARACRMRARDGRGGERGACHRLRAVPLCRQQ